jgi:hypothetical protein
MEDIKAKKTLSVPEAGQSYYGLGKNASYEAAKRGDIPFIQVGGKKRVPVQAMENRLREVE